MPPGHLPNRDISISLSKEEGACPRSRFDSSILCRLKDKHGPSAPYGAHFRIVDLFSGCGPFTLGAAEAASAFGLTPRVALAVDVDKSAAAVFEANFPGARVMVNRVEGLFDGELGAPVTEVERATLNIVGGVHVVLGGPPCQGHSDLNNHTRRNDPRNSLYARMARAIEVLRPQIAIVENVPAVVHADEGVVEATSTTLEEAGYTTAAGVIDLSTLGVPQRRRRHVLIATSTCSGVDANSVLSRVLRTAITQRAARWALEDLVGHEDSNAFDMPTRVSQRNAERIGWLFDHDAYDLPNELRPPSHQGSHSYRSMYGRLRWDEPAQTITTGFGSMGQGRYVHPLEPRMLTAHEAARLQGIPDYFRFEAAKNRTTMRRLIGNAVPPALSEIIVRTALEDLANQVRGKQSQHCVDSSTRQDDM